MLSWVAQSRLRLLVTLHQMDHDRGLLLAWMALVYIRRGAKQDPMVKLPDLPHLGLLLSKSSVYDWTEDCRDEVFKLGQASGFPFTRFLSELELPINVRGYCSAAPITVDTTSEEVFTSSASTESLVSGDGVRSPVNSDSNSAVGAHTEEAREDRAAEDYQVRLIIATRVDLCMIRCCLVEWCGVEARRWWVGRVRLTAPALEVVGVLWFIVAALNESKIVPGFHSSGVY